MIPLAEEFDIARTHQRIEQLRLGDRLRVEWDVEELPMHAAVPSLIVQPLLENAVYHGIEPSAESGEVIVRIELRDDELRLEVDNPMCEAGRHHEGNRMALDNIRERLMLFFDLEAGLDSDCAGGRYRVRIHLPYRSVSA